MASPLWTATFFATLLAAATGCEAPVLFSLDATTPDAGVVAEGAPPQLSEFRIQSDAPDRVTFHSSVPIVGTNPTGLFVSNRPVVEIGIASGELTGHFFRLEEPVDFWDNLTVRYDGGGDIADLMGTPLSEVTLTYIENRIPEPDASLNRYVTVTARGGDDGTTEDAAWTLPEAFESATAGTTVWIKAGDYGNQNFSINLSGTAVSPIKFIGYRSSPGDIDDNYWDGGPSFSASEMPTLTGAFSEENSGRAIYWIDSHYVILRNFQITRYLAGMYSGPRAEQANSHLVFDRVNGYQFNQPGVFDEFSSAFFFNSDLTGNSQLRFLNGVISEYEATGIFLTGDGGNLIDNYRIYHPNDEAKPESNISVGGHHNIVRNCRVEILGSYDSPSTQGIGVRGGDQLSNTYNLIERSTAININEGFFIRNRGSDYNVIKDCYVGNNGATSEYRGGVVIWGGSDHNIVERVVVEDVVTGIGFKDNHEETSVVEDFEIGRNNLIRNCTFDGALVGIGAVEQSEGGDGILHDNQVVNCTFNNVDTLFSIGTNVDVRNLEFINCSFSTVGAFTVEGGGVEGVSFSHSNFWDHWDADGVPPEGTENLSLPPGYIDQPAGDFHLEAGSPLIDVGRSMPRVRFDLEGNHRPQGGAHDIGAHEFSP